MREPFLLSFSYVVLWLLVHGVGVSSAYAKSYALLLNLLLFLGYLDTRFSLMLHFCPICELYLKSLSTSFLAEKRLVFGLF